MRDEGKFVAGQPIHNRTREYKPHAHHSVQNRKQLIDPRRLLKLVFGLGIICFSFWSWQKIADPQTWPISTVQITGIYERVDHNELRQAIMPFIERGFLWSDTAALQDRLQQMPWISDATVKRIWPNKLAINLIEQKPVARMEANILLNAQGDRFAVDPTTIPVNLPLFSTPLPNQQKLILANYTAMSSVVAPLNLAISAISLDARQSWSIELNNGLAVIIGKVEPLQRLQRFVQVYSQIVDTNVVNISSVDLRYNSGITVKFKNQAKA